MDNELLQDFLVEAGEILEQLNEQLVDLEQRPDDKELLNTVFRGFHTIKGGAGFLAIEPMVALCHRSEDVFNLLRNGQRRITPALMDTMLPVLDVLNAQFDALRAGQETEPADPDMLAALEVYTVPGDDDGDVETATEAEVEDTGADATEEEAAEVDATDSELFSIDTDASEQDSSELNITDEEFQSLLEVLENPNAAVPSASGKTATPSKGAAKGSDEISDDEFENLLDELHGKGKFKGIPAGEDKPKTKPGAKTDSENITDDEFEKLLDDLHGKGTFKGVPAAKPANTAKPATAAGKKDKLGTAAKPPKAGGSDNISDDEFESLLDDLHGKGKFSGAPNSNASSTAKSTGNKPTAKPAKTSVEKTTEVAKPKEKEDDKGQAGQAQAVQTEATVRVDTKRLDDIMNMVGELVLVRNRIDRLGVLLGNEELQKACANLDLVTTDLQMSVMKTRMQPIKKVFGRFPRVVRDIARSLKKEINLEMIGEDTELDKNVVDALADPLVHLVRNAVDHGIEMPDVREKAGKPRTGTVLLSAEQEGDRIVLKIQDDGGGMDAERLKAIAIKKGVIDADTAARMDDHDAYNLIFAAGFSTKEQITDISGRGVGMDVVKTRIAQLNGIVEISSELGKGSTLIVKLPLTLAIMPTLMVQLEKQLFALPLVNVNEILHLDLKKTNTVDGQLVVSVRNKTLPLFYLSRWLVKGKSRAPLPKEGHVVVVHIGNQKIGFIVDELIGQEEVVIKPLGALLHGTSGLSGATITGDGAIAIILDVPGLMHVYARHAA